MSVSAQYAKTLNAAARTALGTVVANRPTTSLAELRELLGQNPELGRVTLAELFGGGRVQPTAKRVPSPSSSKPAKAASPKRAKETKAWNTRTDAGRAELDRAVYDALAMLGSDDVSAESVRGHLGASAAQIRTSLARHVESGMVSVAGRARGTRYTVEG